jgi:hypothetical protein
MKRRGPYEKNLSMNDMMPFEERQTEAPQDAPENVPEMQAVMDLAEDAGYDSRAMIEAGDYRALAEAAMKSNHAQTDGGIRAIETFASRLGLGSMFGVDYSKPNETDDYAFGGRAGEHSGPPYRPNMRPGGIGSR